MQRSLSLQISSKEETYSLRFDDRRKELVEQDEEIDPDARRARPVVHTETTRPLDHAIRVFLDAIGGKNDPRLGLELGLLVVRRLESLERAAARKS